MPDAALATLATLDAYDLWAQQYPPMPHNPLMRAEQQSMLKLWPRVADKAQVRALDLACGTGRYARLLAESGVRDVVALDFSQEMLRRASGGNLVRADMMRLPFAADAFDLVVSGLAVGHAARLDRWMMEVARVLKPQGVLLYSDFHPDAAAAGMTRSFTDAQNRKHTLLHHRHDLICHRKAAYAAGLVLELVHEVRVGEELRESFEGSEAFYRRWRGLAVVLTMRVRRP